MAIQSFELDPNATVLTDDEHVAAINAATANITRAGSVEAAARPIGVGEVTDTELATTAARDNLNAMSDVTRDYVRTDPASGEFKIIAIQRKNAGKLEVDFDDVAIP